MSQETKATKNYRQVTTEQLHERFELTPDGLLVWKIQPIGRHKPCVGEVAGKRNDYPNGKSYWQISIFGTWIHRSRVIYCMLHGEWPTAEVDHINGNSLDDRPENLRAATTQQNRWNCHKYPKPSGLPRGVFRTPFAFRARIVVNSKPIWLGSFRTPDAASDAYAAARRKYFGAFA